jgi:hypothetical protein
MFWQVRLYRVRPRVHSSFSTMRGNISRWECDSTEGLQHTLTNGTGIAEPMKDCRS